MTARPLPWSATCFVCGDDNPRGLDAKFRLEDDGRVRLETVVDHAFEGYGGHVHGGVVTAMLDETAGWAACVALGRLCLAIELTVKFRRPVPGGSKVVVLGEAIGKERRFFRAKSTMTDESGKVLATAEGRFMPVAEEIHREVVTQLKMPGRPAALDDI
jgi:uncharacterized protein (TIGR00369 family)